MKSIAIIQFVFFIGLISSCSNHKKNSEKITVETKDVKSDSTIEKSNNYDLLTKIKLTSIDDSIINKMPNKKASVYLAIKYYSEMIDTNQIEDINSKYKSASVISNYGKAIIWEINIKGKYLSDATPKKCYMLYNKDKEEAVFFTFNQLFLLKRKISDTTKSIGGIEISKGVGYFLVYSYKNSSFVKVFDNGFNIGDNTVATPVYLNDGGCIGYSNHFLKFKNSDINKDGFLDISFEGTVLYYCKPNEYGIDISKRKPINREKIKLNYIMQSSENKLKYVLLDTTQIKRLLDIR